VTFCFPFVTEANKVQNINTTTGQASMFLSKSVLFLPGWYDEQMHRGIARCAREAGWILSCPMRHEGRMPAAHKKIDGIITLLSHGRKDITDFVLSRRRIPIVDMSGEIPDLQFPLVRQDNQAIGQLAASHLMAHGCSTLVYVKLMNNSFATERLAGFSNAVSAGSRKLVLLDITKSGIPVRNWTEWLTRKFLSIPKPFGIMPDCDWHAMDVFDACNHAGINIPEDALVIGVDNDELTCTFAPVPLTSVDNNRERHGYEAAQLLDRIMRGRKPPKENIVIPPKFIVERQSTNAIAVNHPLVSKAIGMIWTHYRDPELTPAWVIDQLGCSREGLHRIFKHHIGRSVAEELRRKRMESAMEILITTDKKMEEVASLSGFSSALHLNKVFNREMRETPRGFRKSRKLS